MDYRRIEDLLEKYWSCESSAEEEEELRIFFTTQEVPEPLSRFKPLFLYQEQEKKVGLNNDFDRKMLEKIERHTKRRISPFWQVAAGILLLFGIAGYLRTTVLHHTSEISDTFTSPEEALVQVKQTLVLVSLKLNEGQQKAEQSIEKTEALTKYIK
ncbi:hypothetical protein [uncultured Odoribacter sp.]|uniref:hypothetical protein n=1 Tax=uncultured Odoribacter sp. TaxID=876416 RepID=UPI00262A922A|nr:hypothetical protein [uncultured Odoribacter sp.]